MVAATRSTEKRRTTTRLAGHSTAPVGWFMSFCHRHHAKGPVFWDGGSLISLHIVVVCCASAPVHFCSPRSVTAHDQESFGHVALTKRNGSGKTSLLFRCPLSVYTSTAHAITLTQLAGLCHREALQCPTRANSSRGLTCPKTN